MSDHDVIDSKYGYPLLSCLCWVKSMDPDSEMVYIGYVMVPDLGPVLRAHGFDLGICVAAAWLSCCLE